MKRFAPFSWILFAQAIEAVLVTPLSIQELTTRADLVVHGTILSKNCLRDPSGRIYTKVEVQVREAWKGTPAINPLIVVHGGGTLGEERVEVPGQVEYRVGEEIVAFLVLNPRGEGVTVGLAQGKFHVWKDETSGNLLVRNPFHGAARSESATNSADGFTASARSLTLPALKARVTGKEK